MSVTRIGFASSGRVSCNIGAVVAISTNNSISAGARWIAIRAIWCAWSTGVCWSWGVSWCLLLTSTSSFFCRGAFFGFLCGTFFSFFGSAFSSFFRGFSFSFGFFLCFDLLLESPAFCFLLLPFSISVTNKFEVFLGEYITDVNGFLKYGSI